jgi:hypothetical protein
MTLLLLLLLLLLLSPTRLWQDVVGRPRREHSRLHIPPPPTRSWRAATAVGVAQWVALGRRRRVECRCKHASFKWVLLPACFGLHSLLG